ncbi:hypothetical protein ACHWQZ_G013449 [Mnemiopsis leidyi]
MAIAEVIKGNSTVLSGGLSSETYRILDFLDGSLLVLLFLLSTTLNPIVFYHYWKLPSTVPNILYKVLALADFVTNLVRPILLTVAHFRSHDYRDLFLDPGSYHIFGTITTRVGVTLSSASVALLALTRAIKIQWPFHRIKKRHVTIWLVVVATFEFLIVVANLARDFDNLKLFLCSYLCISFEGFDLGVGRKGYQIHGLSNFESPEYLRNLDFAAGFFLIVLFLLSTTLNPIVFYHYWKLPSTVPNILYRLLALADFTANLIRPLYSAVTHLTPLVVTDILWEASIESSVYTVVIMMSITVSTAAVALIALTRAIKIQWPFYRVKKRLIFRWLGVLLIFQLSSIVYFLAHDRSVVRNLICTGTSVAVRFKRLPGGSVGWRVLSQTILSFVIMYIHALISILVSVWAIMNLLRAIKHSKLTKNSVFSKEGDKRNFLQETLRKFKSCKAIIIINLAYVVMVVGTVIAIVQMPDGDTVHGDQHSVQNCRVSYALNIFLPSIMAATNPLILIGFNEEVQARFSCSGMVLKRLQNLYLDVVARVQSLTEDTINETRSGRVECRAENPKINFSAEQEEHKL